MSRLPTPPHLGLRLPLPPPPKPDAEENADVLQTGDLLDGRYQVEDRLGEGGVGWVYRARQTKLHRRVAVKLLQSDSIGEEEMRPRFEREALTLAALCHPNIVSLNDYGLWQGRPYLVMELLEGRTVRDILDTEGPLAPGRALALVRQVLLALAYAHRLGIVHRDLKPANLLVQTLPCVEHVKVLDFGLVKLLPGSQLDPGVQLSRVGFTFGTPAYMSPEHAAGGEVDGRTDLYAVGVLLFEMLTGTKPFEGELQDLLRHHFQTPVPRLESRCAALSARADLSELQAFVERALAKERDARFADAEQMLEALEVLRRREAGPGAVEPRQSAVRWRPRAGAVRETAARLTGEGLRVARTRVAMGIERAGPWASRVYAACVRAAQSGLSLVRRGGRTAYERAKPLLLRGYARARVATAQLWERLRLRLGIEPSRPEGLPSQERASGEPGGRPHEPSDTPDGGSEATRVEASSLSRGQRTNS